MVRSLNLSKKSFTWTSKFFSKNVKTSRVKLYGYLFAFQQFSLSRWKLSLISMQPHQFVIKSAHLHIQLCYYVTILIFKTCGRLLKKAYKWSSPFMEITLTFWIIFLYLVTCLYIVRICFALLLICMFTIIGYTQYFIKTTNFLHKIIYVFACKIKAICQ